MRRFILPCLMVAAIPGPGVRAHDHEHQDRAGGEFHENRGQWPDQVLYRLRTSGGALFLEPDAFTYVVSSGGHKHAAGKEQVEEPAHRHAYRMHFVGGRAKAHTGLDRLPHYANYFIGNDPAKWAGSVAAFGAVGLDEVYPGIDLRVDAHAGLKYDWLLDAGADASLIRLRFDGQDDVQLRDGMLYITTSAGGIVEQRPVAWSEVNGERVPVPCEYAREGADILYRFPKGYDVRHPLVIDPTVVFGSYIGSTANSWGFTATYDDDGHLYGGGIVFGFGYPVTLGVLQPDFGGDVMDMNVTKFSPDGTSLVWSTYLGGTTGSETVHSMVVNSANELYLMGVSGSSDFPTTTGAFDTSFGFGPPIFFVVDEGYSHLNGADAVIAHFSADATQLLGSTFIGGSDADGLNNSFVLDYNYGDPFRGEIALDQQERPIVVTSTNSADIPVSSNATQSTLGGQQDAYACMLDPGLTTLLWGTYYGGSFDDSAYGVQQAPDGRIYFTGGTVSADLPMSGTPYQSGWSGAPDGYIACYSEDGGTLLATTYLGTPQHDESYFVQIDLAGFVYVVGQTHGAYPVSSGVYANPNASQFIHKFDHELSASQWSTRIGSTGTEDIAPSAFLVSDCGQIYFSGWGGTVNQINQAIFSTTVGLPTTPDALQSTTEGSDFYLMVLNADAASLAYATFYGGTLSPEHVDGGTSRFSKEGIVYQAVCAGCWNNSDFPTTPGAWSNTNDGGIDACNLGVFKLDFEQNVQVSIDASTTAGGACLAEPIVFTAVGTATEWDWDLGDGTSSNDATLTHIYEEPGQYIVRLIGTANAQGLCVAVDTAFLTVNVVAPLVMTGGFTAQPSGTCDAVGVSFTNTSTGSDAYWWEFGDGGTSSVTDPVHPYASPGDYTVILAVIDAVCMDTVYATQTVSVDVPGLTIDMPATVSLCTDAQVVLSTTAAYDTYLWSTGEDTPSITVDEPGEYSVVVTDGFCTGGDTTMVLPSIPYTPFTDQLLCPGEQLVLAPSIAPDPIVWSTGTIAPSITVSVAGEYWFAAIDTNGCIIADTVEVSYVAVVDGEVLIPNVFSPNGDQVNDVYRPENIAAVDYHMHIYDRWGLKVFSTTSSEHGWNGKLDNDGASVPDGTYFVILSYTPYCSEDAVTYHGHVTLLR